jgi:hypothetical protein
MPFAKGGGGEHRSNGARTLKVGLCGNGPACKTSSSKMQDIFDLRQAADVRAYLERRRSSPAVGAALPGTLAGGACPHGILLSLLLQYGRPIEVIAKALSRNSDGGASGVVSAVVDRIMALK